MLRLVHASSSNEETGDAMDVGAEMSQDIEANETNNSVSKKIRVSLNRISESDVDNFNETIENHNVSKNTAPTFPVSNWLI